MPQDDNRREVVCAELRAELRAGVPAALTSAQQAHLAACDECMEALVNAGLTQAPEVDAPPDFAARLCATLPAPQSLPAAEPARRRVTAQGVAVAASVVLALASAAAMAAAPQAWLPPGTVGILVVSLLVTECAGLALWLGLRNTGR